MSNEHTTIAKTPRLELVTRVTNDGRRVFIVQDDWRADTVVFYDHKPKWACDGAFFLNREQCPRDIRNALDRLAGRPYNKTTNRYGTMLRIYDAGEGHPNDRYTVVPPPSDKYGYLMDDGRFLALQSNDSGMFSHSELRPGNHLGRRIPWSELPESVQNAARHWFPEWAPVAYNGR